MLVLTFDEYSIAQGYATDQPMMIMPFHETIMDALVDALLGELPYGKENVMILMPPRHGKTRIVRNFVEYGLGVFPDAEFIYTGYASHIATAQTGQMLLNVSSRWYRSLCPDVHLLKQTNDRFTTTAGGVVYGVGIGGSITGFGAGKKRDGFGGAIVIDDPLKSEDVRSEVTMQDCREWYTRTLQRRKNSARTSIILIMQRLHPNDLAGYLLDTEPEKWHVVKIPVMNDDGTTIWPETFSAENYHHLKRVDPVTASTQYDQDAVMPGGNVIKRDWWTFYDAATYDVAKMGGYVFITADTAMKAGDHNDYSSIAVWNGTGRYLDRLDCIRGKWTFPDLVTNVKRFWEFWNRVHDCQMVYIEDKASGTPLGQLFASQDIPTRLWKPQDYSFPADKLGRAKQSTWFIEGGRVRLPDDNPHWMESFILECAKFTGKETDTDDQVDELTMAISIWRRKGGAEDLTVLTDPRA